MRSWWGKSGDHTALSRASFGVISFCFVFQDQASVGGGGIWVYRVTGGAVLFEDGTKLGTETTSPVPT